MSFWTQLIQRGRRLFDLDAIPDPDPSDPDVDCAPDPNDVGFTAAVVGLGAKMAKADGVVSDAEVMMFARVFQAAPEEATNVRRLFNIARRTVRGYESYARKIGKKYRHRPCLLEGVLDGLFHIAMADGAMTDDELTYLKTVSHAFNIDEAGFRRIKARHLGAERGDPYNILGVEYDAEFEDIRNAYRRLMADNHPDKVQASAKVPEDETAIHDKAAAITAAYAQIRLERGLLVRAD